MDKLKGRVERKRSVLQSDELQKAKAYFSSTKGFQRLKQLDRVSSPELAPLKEGLLQTGLAGYQEGILNDLWCDVKQYMQEFRIPYDGNK